MDQLSFGSIKKMYMSSLFKCVVYIRRAEVEQVSSYRFIGITITENQWSSHISTLIKKSTEEA